MVLSLNEARSLQSLNLVSPTTDQKITAPWRYLVWSISYRKECFLTESAKGYLKIFPSNSRISPPTSNVTDVYVKLWDVVPMVLLCATSWIVLFHKVSFLLTFSHELNRQFMNLFGSLLFSGIVDFFLALQEFVRFIRTPPFLNFSEICDHLRGVVGTPKILIL